MKERYDTVIIGGGQAGLAMSYCLQQRGREHIIIERRRIAERWRTERWDSLRFQMPNWSLQLPGKSYAGDDPHGFADYSDILRFVEDYAGEIAAPVRTGTEVMALDRDDHSDGFSISTARGAIAARHVVIATGPFQRPQIPEFSRGFPSYIYQTDATHYRNPDELPAGSVLIVGSGASGCQIAEELLRNGRKVFLSISRHRSVPRRYRNRDVVWWAEKLKLFDVPIDSFPGKKYPPTTIMTGIDGGHDIDARALAKSGATLLGRVRSVSESKLGLADDAAQILKEADKSYTDFISAANTLAATHAMRTEVEQGDGPPPQVSPQFQFSSSLDLRAENIRSVIWTAGHGYTFDWVKLPIFDAGGMPIQQRGVTDCPGAYFLGLHWMHTFGSGILAYVGKDAAFLADHMDRMAG